MESIQLENLSEEKLKKYYDHLEEESMWLNQQSVPTPFHCTQMAKIEKIWKEKDKGIDKLTKLGL